MNKIKYLFFVLIAGVAFSSCLDDNTEDYSVWKGQNDAFFESVLTDSIDDNGNALYTKIYSGSYQIGRAHV